MLSFLFDLFNAPDLLHFAQAGWWDDFWNGVEVEWSSAGQAIDSYMINLFNVHLMEYGVRMSEELTGAARALGAILAIIVAAGQAYKVMAEGERFHVLTIMRPLIFSFVLACWPAICSTLLAPGRLVESYMKTNYVEAAKVMEDLRKDRMDAAYKWSDKISGKKAAADNLKGMGLHEVLTGEFWAETKTMMTGVLQSSILWILNVIEGIIITLGELLFACGVYIVFMLKVLYLTVLMMFGPIFVVCSILDVWKSSWSDWLGRMIHVSMYGAMAYLVMTFACTMICMTLRADIARLGALDLDPNAGFMQYLRSGFGTTVLTFVGYMVGCIAMTSVPELASLTFPGHMLHGGSSFISGMSKYGKKYSNTQKMLG